MAIWIALSNPQWKKTSNVEKHGVDFRSAVGLQIIGHIRLLLLQSCLCRAHPVTFIDFCAQPARASVKICKRQFARLLPKIFVIIRSQ